MPLSRSVYSTIAFLALSICPLLAQDRIEFTDELYPGCNVEGWFVTQVVDDLTGKPISGAEIYLVGERTTPTSGEFWYSHKVTSDTEGVIRIRLKDVKDKLHIIVLRHPAYAICSEYAHGDDIWRIGRGFDVPVLVRDWRGNAVFGARIGFCGGCGHSPDLINATTGADGVALLRGIDPHNSTRDIYVQHPGLGLGYDSLEWSSGSPPWIIQCGYAPAMTGKVIDSKGKPVGGAYVSARECHRGPWARTATDGTFTMLGSQDGSIDMVRTSEGAEIFYENPKGYPVTLTVPDPLSDDPREGSVFTDPRDITPLVKTRRVRVETSGEVICTTEFPGKPYEKEKKGFVTVPEEGEFVIRISTGWTTRSYLFAAADDLPSEPLVFAPMPLTKLRGRIVDSQGTCVRADIKLCEQWKSEESKEGNRPTLNGRFALLTAKSGRALLQIKPRWDERNLRSRLLWINLPLRAVGAELDLGDITLNETPRLVVLDAEGDPLSKGKIEWARAGMQEAGSRLDFALDYDGEWIGPDLCTGDALWIKPNDEGVSHHVVLSGTAPWKFQLPAGQLTLRIRDQAGEPIRSECLIGDTMQQVEGERTLRGLSTGSLRLFVSASGYRTAIVDTHVGTDSHLLEIILPSR